MTNIHEHVTIMASSLYWEDFKQSLFTIRRFVWTKLEAKNRSEPPFFVDDASYAVENVDDEAIRGLKELSTAGLEAQVKLDVMIHHLFHAVESLEFEGANRFTQLGPTERSKLPQYDFDLRPSKRLEDYIRCRRRTAEDIEKLLSSPTIKPCTKAAPAGSILSDDLDQWVRHKVAFFLEKGLSVHPGPQYFRLMICFADCFDQTVYEEGLYLSCADVQRSISNAPETHPSHLFAQFGASESELLHKTTTYVQTLMCMALSDVTGANEPAQGNTSAVVSETLLKEALASIMGRSLLPSFTPTNIEWKIVQTSGDLLMKSIFREATRRYWDSRNGHNSTDTSNNILIERFRTCFDRLFPLDPGAREI